MTADELDLEKSKTAQPYRETHAGKTANLQTLDQQAAAFRAQTLSADDAIRTM